MLRRARLFWSALVTFALVVSVAQGVAFVRATHAARALAASAATGTGGQFVPATGRILDTRSASQVGPYNTQMSPGVWRSVPVDGLAGIPASGVSAVAVELTVVTPSAAGWLTGGKDQSHPTTDGIALVNFVAGGNQSNAAVLAVGDDGAIALVADQSVDVVVDVEGYYTASSSGTAPGGYVPITPTRFVDTRSGKGLPEAKLAGGSTTRIQMSGVAGVPAGASAVMLEFTVVNNTANGTRFLQPYADDQSRSGPGINFVNGITDTDAAQVALSAAGSTNPGAFDVYLSGTTPAYSLDLIVDVLGYFTPGVSTGSFTPGQARVWDSRVSGHTTVAAGVTTKVQIAGASGVPSAGSGIGSITANVAIIDSTNNGTQAQGQVTLWPDGTTKPGVAQLTYQPVGATSNMATVQLGADGAIELYNTGPDTINFIIDIEGWYSNTGAAINNGQDQTAQSVTLQAAPTGGGSWVTYQYRVGTTGTFLAVPVANTADGNGNHPSAWPVQESNGAFTAYTWNIYNTLAAANGGATPDSLIQVQACYGVSSSDSNPDCGMPSDIDFSLTNASSSSQQVGPGSVDELTGNYSLSATDADAASTLGNLSVGRSLDTLNPASFASTSGVPNSASGVFGPGWTADLSDDAASADLTPIDDSAQGFILLTDSDGDETIYKQDPNNSQRFLGAIDDAGDQSVVTRPNSTTIVLADPDGTTTTWTNGSNGWQASSVVQPGSNSTTAYSYNGSGLVTRILAPVPSGVSCSSPDTTPGCRSLVLSYGSVSAGGSSVTRLTQVSLSIPQTTGTANSIAVADYDYDSAGRLAHAWDPRISPTLKTAYTYTSANRLATLTPPGLATWTFGYDSSNRLITVSRPDPSGSTATTTIVYGISPTTSGSNAGPVDLSAATDAEWGETADLPVTGTAIFNPDHQPAGTIPSAVSSGDWPHAAIDYLDVNGNTVNSANYGAGTWLVDTTQYDSYGNQLWSLTAGNRAQALSPTSDTDPYVAGLSSGTTIDSVDAAALLRSDTVYNPLVPGQVTDTFGPTHPVRLASGTMIDARTHVATTYDEGAPTTTTDPTTGLPVNPATGQPYGLPTTVTTTAYNVATQTDTTWPDIQVTHSGYNSVVSGDTSGWTLGKATSSTVQMGASASSSDLVTYTRYDANGRTIEQRLPNDTSGTTPRTTDTVYYAASGSGACVDPTKAGLVCSTSPAAQPSTGNPLAVVTYGYNQYGDQTSKTETYGTGSNQVVRTTTTGYDTGERKTSSSITVTPTAAGGAAVPTVNYGYDPATGLATTTSTGSGASTVTLTTTYNALGRPTSYTDATGNVSTIGYDLNGRTSSVNDGVGTNTYSYNSSNDYRGLDTGEAIGVSTAPSNFAATYDAAGNLATLTYPNGLVASRHYDNAGDLTSLTYAKSGNTWMNFTQDFNAVGQIADQSSPQSSQTFTYDSDDRLTTVQDTYNGSCTTRVYGYDAHSNRDSLASYSASSGSACTTSTTPTNSAYSYDQADRLTSDTAGSYAYDSLGRTTTIPAADAQGTGPHALISGNATLTYYANDMVSTEKQGSTTDSFTLDPNENRTNTQTEGSSTTTSHYVGNTDAPSWTATGSTWTRNILGPDGNLSATSNQAGGVVLQLTNPHGDVVATCGDTGSETGTSTYSESTEFGVPRNATSANATYGWLGAKQRSSNDLSGLILMGVRLYSSATGRFESADPIAGGNANPYIYPDDPINDFDISGMCWTGFGWACHIVSGIVHWVHRAYRWAQRHIRLLAGIAVAAVATVALAAACYYGGCEAAAEFFATSEIASVLGEYLPQIPWVRALAFAKQNQLIRHLVQRAIEWWFGE